MVGLRFVCTRIDRTKPGHSPPPPTGKQSIFCKSMDSLQQTCVHICSPSLLSIRGWFGCLFRCWAQDCAPPRCADDQSRTPQTTAWPTLCLRQHWLLGGYVARLTDDRWARRILDWRPPGRRKLGRPTRTWESKFEEFCGACDLGDWKPVAADAAFWKNMTDDFVGYCLNR